MPLYDTSYKHWEGVHRGVWHRRWVIAWNGIAAALQNKWMRHLVLVCWMSGLLMTAALFVVGQLLVRDSVVVQWIGGMNENFQGFARSLTGWLEQHPEVSVRTSQNLLFYVFAVYLLPVTIFALGMALPLLVTRDLASNAIIIYSSKAISRGDYFLGKFGTALGLMTLTWLGPICSAWFVGNLLAPDWRFFWHARLALFHILLFGLGTMCALSLLALGVSALSKKEKSTPAFWFMWWVFGGVITPIAIHTKPWLRHLSFNYNLDQVALAVFRLSDDLKIAQDNIPVFGAMLRLRPQTVAAIDAPPALAAALALAGMAIGALILLRARVKPE